MDRIETGTTGERKTRLVIFSLLFLGFGVYSMYDYVKGYPEANVTELRQKLPPTDKALTIVPGEKVSKATVESLRARLKTGTVSRQEVIDLLGEPVLEQGGALYFIGRAVFCKVAVKDGNAVAPRTDAEERDFAQESNKHKEAEVDQQRTMGIITLAVGALGLIQLIRVSVFKVVVDDAGLAYGGRRIAWNAIEKLDVSDCRKKGRVTIEFKDGDEADVLKLDDYKVKDFRGVVTAICLKKGLADPFAEGAAES